jgi:hypothetical protein
MEGSGMKEFRTAGGFAAHLTRLAAEIGAAEFRGMDAGAAVIEHAAKAAIGTYQRENLGQNAPWEELAERTKAERVSLGFTENDPGLRDGEMRDSISRTVRLPEAAVGSNDDKLEWFELGTAHQPARSVLSLAAHREGEKAAGLVGAHVAWTVAGLPFKVGEAP